MGYMAVWTLIFEISNLLCFLLFFGTFLIRKAYRDLSTLCAGAIFGVALEFINVSLTGAYTYSKEFFLQVGGDFNIPIVIGLAWGMLLQTSHEITEGYRFPLIIRTLFESVFVVSVDFFLDVVAVRLDGGFWTWTGIPLTNVITAESALGIPWGNYYGWFLVIFFMSLVLHFMDKKKDATTAGWLILRTLGAVMFAEVFLFLALMLTILFTTWQAVWILFLLPYLGSIVAVVIDLTKNHRHRGQSLTNWLPFGFYLFSYSYCIITMIALGLVGAIWWYFVLNLLFAVGSVGFLFKITEKRRPT